MLEVVQSKMETIEQALEWLAEMNKQNAGLLELSLSYDLNLMKNEWKWTAMDPMTQEVHGDGNTALEALCQAKKFFENEFWKFVHPENN